MALINIGSILNESIRVLRKAGESGGVGLFSYKRNRRVVLVKLTNETCLIKENGYVQQEKVVKITAVEKDLRSIIKREFPRSRKIRLYKFSNEDELKTEYKKI